MGYDLHITRRKDWSQDEPQNTDIKLEEWISFIEQDPELQLSDAYRIKVPGNENESQVAPGYCEWINHPLDERPSFVYSSGCISTKNPDEDTVRKILLISKVLNAKVQGDDGETYELSSNGEIINNPDPLVDSNEIAEKKPWWKFW